MRYAILASIIAILTLPTLTLAEGFEAIAIGNTDVNESHFSMISLRKDLNFGAASVAEDTSRNAPSGLRLRLDASRSAYNTNYDATSGTGTSETYRFLLSYGIPMDSNTTITLTGGVSHRSDFVRPITLNSPADKEKTAEFLSLEFEYSPASFGTFQGLAEHDGSGANYASASYLINIGENFRIGPTMNYVSQGDYSRDAFGLSTIYVNGDKFEIKVTIANADQNVGSNPSTEVDYFELQMRTTF